MVENSAPNSSSSGSNYSYYYWTLEVAPWSRYKEKLGRMQDPYTTINSARSDINSLDWWDWPSVEYPGIYNYLATIPSCYTKQQLKAYKSLEGYKYFVDGWVHDILPCLACTIPYLVTGKSSIPSDGLELLFNHRLQ